MNLCRSGSMVFIHPERVLRDTPVVHYGEAPRAAASFNQALQRTRRESLLRALAVLIFIPLVGCVAPTYTTNGDKVPLVKRANGWKPGESIPPELLVFRESPGCFPLLSDTVQVFGSITNYALLKSVVFSACDERIFECAATRALELIGPIRFFGDARERYSAEPALLSEHRHIGIRARSEFPHVVVDGLFINDNDMPPDKAMKVFSQITADLKARMPFDDALKKYYDAYEYSYVETLSNGTRVTLRRTRVGNFGDFTLFEQGRDAYPFRLAEVPEAHVQPLLTHRPGDVVVLRDDVERRSILYRVREFYSPAQ